jgi:hypothetical protein
LKLPNDRTETLHEFLKEFEESATKDYNKIIDFLLMKILSLKIFLKNNNIKA